MNQKGLGYIGQLSRLMFYLNAIGPICREQHEVKSQKKGGQSSRKDRKESKESKKKAKKSKKKQKKSKESKKKLLILHFLSLIRGLILFAVRLPLR